MVYEYTKPRGPVAAMFTGPGPSYGLPGLTGRSNHDPCSRFVKAPAFHLGSRSLGNEQSAGPGPCYMPQPKVWIINIAYHCHRYLLICQLHGSLSTKECTMDQKL